MSEHDKRICGDMKQYRKKPIIIHAVQMNGDFVVDTLEGEMRGKAGDYLVYGTHDEEYPVRKDIFEENYEEVKRYEILF